MKIITILGARPQFIKAATISRAIKNWNKTNQKSKINEVIVHTGQHFDSNMSEVFFEQMDIPKPKYNLQVAGLNHGAMTGRMIEKIENILIKETPDYVLVYGDTNSTLAGAIASVKLNIPVIHIEAGLRSFNNKMPEEINRILVDRISNILFCPTENAKNNLKKESFPFITKNNKKQKIYNIGDVMYDAVLFYRKKVLAEIDLNTWGVEEKKYILCTIHRVENTNNIGNLIQILQALNQIAKKNKIIMPIHPRTRQIIKKNKIDFLLKNLLVIDPVPYFEMLRLEIGSSLIITDSGGVQKEAYFNKIPCITLRQQTEWIETVQAKWNILVGSDKNKILLAFKYLNNTLPKHINYFGKGNSADLILQKIILNYYKHKIDGK